MFVSVFQDGNTCLHTSSENSTPDVVALFISQGLDPNSTNNVSVTHNTHCNSVSLCGLL